MTDDDMRQLLIMLHTQQQLTARALDIIIHMMREGDPGGDDGPPAGPVPEQRERMGSNKISTVPPEHGVSYR